MADERLPQPGPVREFRFAKDDKRRAISRSSREVERYNLYVRYCASVDVTPMDYDTWFIRIANTAYTFGTGR